MVKLKRFIKVASSNTQLILWIFGANLHNPVTDECTPDFSCCTSIKTPFLKRVKSFRKHWLMVNLGKYVN